MSQCHWLSHEEFIRKKTGPQGTQKLSSFKSTPPPKNTGMCHNIIRNCFLMQF